MLAQATIDLIDHIKRQIESKQLVSKFDGLLEMVRMISKSGSENLIVDIEKSKAGLIDDLTGIESADWLYSRFRMLAKIDKYGVVGERGARNLVHIFETNRTNPAGLLQQITIMIDEINKLKHTDTDLLKLFVDEKEPDNGKSLLTLIFEGSAGINSIGDIERYARIWDKIIRDYSCLISASEIKPKIRYLDKEYMVIEIPGGDSILESISYGATSIIDAYKKILRIRKLQLEAVVLALDDKIYEALEFEAKTIVEKTSRKVVAELMNMNDINDVTDNDDLFVSIMSSLGQILDFIDKGGKIECVSSKDSEALAKGNKLFLTAYHLVDEIDNVSFKICDIIGGTGVVSKEE